mmetsp:Transcript_32209/g.104018  ORF Transcript_32209/g.104018 Transcript_32209/m.104018 type:complete len:240 (+) Transcript_32209:995-1714(+)
MTGYLRTACTRCCLMGSTTCRARSCASCATSLRAGASWQRRWRSRGRGTRGTSARASSRGRACMPSPSTHRGRCTIPRRSRGAGQSRMRPSSAACTRARCPQPTSGSSRAPGSAGSPPRRASSSATGATSRPLPFWVAVSPMGWRTGWPSAHAGTSCQCRMLGRRRCTRVTSAARCTTSAHAGARHWLCTPSASQARGEVDGPAHIAMARRQWRPTTCCEKQKLVNCFHPCACAFHPLL